MTLSHFARFLAAQLIMVAAAAAFFLAALPGTALPDERPGPRPPGALFDRMEEMAAWIGERSDLPGTMARPPAVAFLPRPVLNYLVIEGLVGAAYSGQTHVMAMYFEGMMFLAEGYRPGEDDYVLLHELVHHLQFLSGRDYPCGAAEEREAYELQIAWVEETGRGQVPNELFMVGLTCERC